MEKTLHIEGMMCEHCEARVKEALEALDGVSAAKVSHTDGSAVLSLNADVADSLLKDAVEKAGYQMA